jgi:hypothetical protein
VGVKKKDMTTFTRLKYLKQGRKRMTLYKWYKSVGRNSGKFVCFFLLQFFNTCDDPWIIHSCTIVIYHGFMRNQKLEFPHALAKKI